MKEKILALLKEKQEYVSGEELSSIFGITRSAIWKYIKALRNEGYVIDSVTNKGYLLKSCTNVLNAAEVSQGLHTHYIGKEILCLPTVDSTNEEVKRLAQNGAEQGLVVVSEEQTLGKGRLGRQWKSPKGTGIWFSILIRPDLSPTEVAGVTLAAGLGLCKAIRKFTGCNAQIKWPNDIIIGNKKLCGILTEMAAEAEHINYCIIGIGVNANTKEFEPEIASKATSLSIETGEDISRSGLLREVLEQIEICLDDYLLNVTNNIVNDYTRLCATIGRTIKTTRGGKELVGEAVGLGKQGELSVRLNNGEYININSGEVTVQGIY